MSIYCILIKIRSVLYLYLGGGGGGGYTLTFHNNPHVITSAELSFTASSPLIRTLDDVTNTGKRCWSLIDFNT